MFWEKILSKKCFFFVREEINLLIPYYIYQSTIKLSVITVPWAIHQNVQSLTKGASPHSVIL